MEGKDWSNMAVELVDKGSLVGIVQILLHRLEVARWGCMVEVHLGNSLFITFLWQKLNTFRLHRRIKGYTLGRSCPICTLVS